MGKVRKRGLLSHPVMRRHIIVGFLGGLLILMGWGGIASAVEAVAKGGLFNTNDWKFGAGTTIFSGILFGAALTRFFDIQSKVEHGKER